MGKRKSSTLRKKKASKNKVNFKKFKDMASELKRYKKTPSIKLFLQILFTRFIENWYLRKDSPRAKALFRRIRWEFSRGINKIRLAVFTLSVFICSVAFAIGF